VRCIHLLGAAECGGEDLLPKRTLLKRLAAAAAIPLRDAALPRVYELADRAHTGHLSEQAIDQRATAAANAPDIDNPQFAPQLTPESTRLTPSSGRRTIQISTYQTEHATYKGMSRTGSHRAKSVRLGTTQTGRGASVWGGGGRRKGRRSGMRSDQGIVVTGLPRSGTSWIGRMLEASGEAVYVNEPLNPQHPPGRSPGVLNAQVSHRYEYICADNDERWVRAFNDTLGLRYHLIAELRRNRAPYDLARMAKYATAFTVGRLRRRRALIDDPFGVMSVAWFAQRLGCHVVISVRHPVSFVGSWRRLGWKAHLHDLLQQPLLLRDLLGPYEGELRATADSPDLIAKAAVLWRVTYAAIGDLDARHPGLVHMKRYEDLARNPEEGFRELYATCGLTWSERARRRIIWATTDHGKAEAQRSWTLRGGLSRTAFRPMNPRSALGTFRDRLSQQEIDQVLETTASVATRYYGARDGLTPV